MDEQYDKTQVCEKTPEEKKSKQEREPVLFGDYNLGDSDAMDRYKIIKMKAPYQTPAE